MGWDAESCRLAVRYFLGAISPIWRRCTVARRFCICSKGKLASHNCKGERENDPERKFGDAGRRLADGTPEISRPAYGARRLRNVGRLRGFDMVVGASNQRCCPGGLGHPGASHWSWSKDLDPLEARQIEHRVEQDALQDRAQRARAGLALDCLLGDRRERLVGDCEI